MQRLVHFLRYLECRDVLSDEEKRAITGLPWRVKSFETNETIIRQGAVQEDSCLLVEGFVSRSHVLEDGSRMFSALHVPGDFVDLHAFTLKVMDHDVMAIKGCTTAFVSHQSLRALFLEWPHLGRLFWLSTTIDGAIQRAWITAMGRQSSKGQLAHLICELFTRLKTVGLVNGDSFDLPVTQVEVSDIMGISAVHVNRTLQFLRREGAVIWKGQTVTIVDWDRLCAKAQFDPAYLNLVRLPR